jgi:hypothetical protein
MGASPCTSHWQASLLTELKATADLGRTVHVLFRFLQGPNGDPAARKIADKVLGQLPRELILKLISMH